MTHEFRFFSAPLRPSRLLAGPLLALLASGCIGPRPEVEAEKSISDSLAIEHAVCFHRHATPIDQSPSALDALPLTEAVRRAVMTSAELQGALARVRVAEAESDVARLLPNPILSFTERFPEGGGTPDIEASLSVDLLAILQRPRRSTAAAHRLEAAAAVALQTAIDVVAETQALYADAQALDEAVPLLEARIAVLDRLREVLQARLELGEGTRHEVTTIDAERLNLSVEASQKRRELTNARIALTKRIGEPSGSASWTLDPWQRPIPVPTLETAWIDVALESRPEVREVVSRIQALEEEYELAKSDSFDGLTASVDRERDDGEDSFGPGVAIPVRVFDRSGARKRRVEALTLEAQHQLTEIQRGVVEDVRSTLATLSGSQENLDRVVRDLIPLQERRRSEIDEAFRAGFVDITALLVAEQALQESQTCRIGLEHEVSTAHARLERAVGGPAAFQSVVSVNNELPTP